MATKKYYPVNCPKCGKFAKHESFYYVCPVCTTNIGKDKLAYCFTVNDIK